MRKTIVVLVLAAGVVSAQDSPLVALAKRTNRKASKTPVITNDRVAKSNGRISLAGGEGQALPAAAPAPPAEPRQVAAVVPATPAASAPAPASLTTTVRNIEPQSSARFIPAQSSARTIDPIAVRPVVPQSTAPTVQPQSTARNIAPQSSTQPPK